MKWKSLILIGLIAYVFFLVLKLPAAWLVSPINQALPSTMIAVAEPSGSVWQGSMRLEGVIINPRGSDIEPLFMSWSIKAWRLLIGEIASQVTLHGGVTHLAGEVKVGFRKWAIQDLTGNISPEFIEALMIQHGVEVSNAVELSRINLAVEREQGIGETLVLNPLLANGRVRMLAGPVRIKANNMRYVLPNIVSTLTLDTLSPEGRQIVLNATPQEEPNEPLLTLSLSGKGECAVVVFESILAATGKPSANPKDTLMEASFAVW